MNTSDVKMIAAVLESMIEYELTLSQFYKQCANSWIADETFWQKLADAEIGHAENIRKMREIILKKQDNFQTGRPFNLFALNTAMSGLRDNIKRLASGAITLEKMLVLARDIEQSILESHYAEIVKTNDIEYLTLMKGVLSDTAAHKKIIQQKIEDKMDNTQ